MTSLVVVAGCGVQQDEPTDAMDQPPRVTFQQRGDEIELPIGDIVLVVQSEQLNNDTRRRMYEAREHRVNYVTLHIPVSDFGGEVPGRERLADNEVWLNYIYIPNSPPYDDVADFAERVNGYEGPTRYSDSVSYYETPTGSGRYYVSSDEEYLRENKRKPWLNCPSADPDSHTQCVSAGGWVSDSVFWNYRLFSRHLENWLEIDMQLTSRVNELIKADRASL